METYSKPPSECTNKELGDFQSLVLEGGEVMAAGLLDRIKIAKELIFVNNGNCIGVGAIKQPYDNYKNNVFKKAGVTKQADSYSLELGWLYTSPSARGQGVGHKLMQHVVGIINGASCFATTREDNDAMHYIFQSYAFTKIGEKYESDNGGYSLVLYAYKP